LWRTLIFIHFMQIDADFIAQYQMNYGCGETEEAKTSEQYTYDYWSNPPSDINSDEYRVWYERYCSYFYPQAAASETDVSSSSLDTTVSVQPDASFGSNNYSTGTVSSTTNVDKPPDTKNDTAAGAGDVGGKKKRKNKKDGAVNPTPAEPPGELSLVLCVLSCVL